MGSEVEGMIKRPVGVYDSGVGGISVLRALRARLPSQPFVYVADSGHAPYGDRDADFVTSRALAVARALAPLSPKALVLACNTVSVVAAKTLRAELGMPVVAMEPAIKPAVAQSKSKIILLLATRNTVRSEAVESLRVRFGAGAQILAQACPGLVEQVERGALDDPATDALIERFVRPGVAAGADTIVLGCTHYAFLGPAIARIAGPGAAIIEPSAAIAEQLARLIEPGEGGRISFRTSGDVATLRSFLEKTWGSEPEIQPL